MMRLSAVHLLSLPPVDRRHACICSRSEEGVINGPQSCLLDADLLCVSVCVRVICVFVHYHDFPGSPDHLMHPTISLTLSDTHRHTHTLTYAPAGA